MGGAEHLQRVFYVSTESYPREFLLSSKLLALDWEREWLKKNARMVNVDTGFVSLENFLLATTKNFSHRIFIGQNQFADLTYQFVEQSFQFLPWTYPDFKDQDKLDFFNWCRSFLLMQSKLVQS
jgi:archaellum biogenesis ATPase FlaH